MKTETRPVWKLDDPYPTDWVSAEDLHLAEGNPRRGVVEEIAESIRANGFCEACGRSKKQRGRHCPACAARWRAVGKMGEPGQARRHSASLDLPISTVADVVRGRTWRHVG